jgi:nucleotide-binding universal stress UspA family protein
MMFDRVLVPLDGSILAEGSLPAAGALARKVGSVLILVHLLESGSPTEVHGQRHLTDCADAERYLEAVRARLGVPATRTEVHVGSERYSDVAVGIDSLAETLNVGSVLMCAHGGHALRGRLAGSIAQRVLRIGRRPIVFRTVGASTDSAFQIRRILAPVDFRHDLCQPSAAVLALAAGFRAAVTLIHISEPSSALQARLMPGASAGMRRLDRHLAQRRLSDLATRYSAQRIDIEAAVNDGPADQMILEEAQRRRAEVIVLSTHARSGVEAWSERAVAQRLMQARDLTLILLREPGAGQRCAVSEQPPPTEGAP